MREIRLCGSEGGGVETNRSFPPLSMINSPSLFSRGAEERMSRPDRRMPGSECGTAALGSPDR